MFVVWDGISFGLLRVGQSGCSTGSADNFLEGQLRTPLLEAACAAAGIPATIRMQEGYDHSYFFISTFIAEHVAWHATRLTG